MKRNLAYKPAETNEQMLFYLTVYSIFINDNRKRLHKVEPFYFSQILKISGYITDITILYTLIIIIYS